MARRGRTENLVEKETTLRFGCGHVTHTLMPPHAPETYTTTSNPFSIGVSFTGHTKAVVEFPSGQTSERTFGPGTFGITGEDAVKWLRVAEPAEAVEIYPSAPSLERIESQIGTPLRSVLHSISGGVDPVIWAICSRFRMAAQDVIAMSELEAEELMQTLPLHTTVHHFGTRPLKPPRGKLHPRRLVRVAALVESRLTNPPSLAEMAQAAAMSPFHFQRIFRATTGSSPHEYVTARRMEAARRMLEWQNMNVAQTASALGFRDLAHFRRVFRRQFGRSPRGEA